MKKIPGIILLISTIILFTQCHKQTERIALTQKISVELPVDYKTKQHDNYKGGEIYGALINKDEVFIAKIIEPVIYTFSMNEKKKSILTNIKGYMKPFKGSNLEHSEKAIGEILQSNFSFEFIKKGTIFNVFGRIIQQDTNLIILTYKTISPISNRSSKDKDRFFNSVKYKY